MTTMREDGDMNERELIAQAAGLLDGAKSGLRDPGLAMTWGRRRKAFLAAAASIADGRPQRTTVDTEGLGKLPIGTVVLDRHGSAAQVVRAHDRQGDVLLYFVGNPDPYDAGREGRTGPWPSVDDWGPFEVAYIPQPDMKEGV
jgi:hypothetical protein